MADPDSEVNGETKLTKGEVDDVFHGGRGLDHASCSLIVVSPVFVIQSKKMAIVLLLHK